jgi:hypothetical protein
MDEDILSVNSEDLERLNQIEAVDAFRDLLWAEANYCGIAANLLSVPSAINVRDGGVDAEISDVELPDKNNGIIKEGKTCYQIKSGDFNIRQRNKRKEILERGNSGELNHKVKECLDSNGTLIIVLFGWDQPLNDGSYEESFQDSLQEFTDEYNNPDIEVWLQNTLRGYFRQFPNLALRLNRKANLHFETFHEWGRRNEVHSRIYHPDDSHERWISTIREKLEDSGSRYTSFIRIIGNRGIGKTRLAFEALNKKDLKHLVCYTTATNFEDSRLERELRRKSSLSAIVVIDECDRDECSRIWDKFKHLDESERLTFITITGDPEEPISKDIDVVELEAIEEEQCKQILLDYDGVDEELADHFAGYCEGYPRFAHLLGQNLEHEKHPLEAGEHIQPWDRCIAGRDEIGGDGFEQRKLVP